MGSFIDDEKTELTKEMLAYATKPQHVDVVMELMDILYSKEQVKLSDDELKDLIQKADAATPDTIKSLVTELLELRESDRRKTDALENAREGFALMAEGEGEDHRVYMKMSAHHMNQCDAALSGKDAE